MLELMKNPGINTITTMEINNMEKIVIFDQVQGKFIKNIFTTLHNRYDLRCRFVSEAFDFKSVQSAQEWAQQSGFPFLTILKQALI
jgi:hypothetical protein